jgi:hypothetical protein
MEEKLSTEDSYDSEDELVERLSKTNRCKKCGCVSLMRPKCQCDNPVAVPSTTRHLFMDCNVCGEELCYSCYGAEPIRMRKNDERRKKFEKIRADRAASSGYQTDSER